MILTIRLYDTTRKSFDQMRYVSAYKILREILSESWCQIRINTQNKWQNNSGADKHFIVYFDVSSVFAAIIKKLHRTSERDRERTRSSFTKDSNTTTTTRWSDMNERIEGRKTERHSWRRTDKCNKSLQVNKGSFNWYVYLSVILYDQHVIC